MADTVTIDGLEPLLKTLAGLPSKVAMNVLRPALETAGSMVAAATRMHAMKVLRDAESKGYRRKSGKHLYEATGSRTKMYQKGASVFVAVGFQPKAGGYHGHLVEEGHRIVKGGTMARAEVRDEFGQIVKKARTADLSAAGKRWLEAHGYVSKSTRINVIGRGRKKILVKVGKRGGWTDVATGKFIKTKDITNERFKQQLRGGGRVLTDTAGAARMTQPRPMLRTAWAETKGAIASLLELQISMGINTQARELAASNGVKQ